MASFSFISASTRSPFHTFRQPSSVPERSCNPQEETVLFFNRQKHSETQSHRPRRPPTSTPRTLRSKFYWTSISPSPSKSITTRAVTLSLMTHQKRSRPCKSSDCRKQSPPMKTTSSPPSPSGAISIDITPLSIYVVIGEKMIVPRPFAKRNDLWVHLFAEHDFIIGDMVDEEVRGGTDGHDGLVVATAAQGQHGLVDVQILNGLVLVDGIGVSDEHLAKLRVHHSIRHHCPDLLWASPFRGPFWKVASQIPTYPFAMIIFEF